MRMFWPFIAEVFLCQISASEWRITNSEWFEATRYSSVLFASLDDAGDDAGADGAAAFADREAELLFHRDRHDQVHFHRDVVARHHHFRALRQVHHAGHVGGAEIELRTIVVEERRVAATLFLGEDIGLGLELGVRLDRAGLAEHL